MTLSKSPAIQQTSSFPIVLVATCTYLYRSKEMKQAKYIPVLPPSYVERVLGKKGSMGKAGVITRKAFLRRSWLGNTLQVEVVRSLFSWDTEIVKD